MMKPIPLVSKPIWAIVAVSLVLTSANSSMANQSTVSGQAFSPESSQFSSLNSHFPRPPEILDAVNFWRQVFGEWRAHQIVLHDDKYLGIIYETVEITGYIGGKLSPEQQSKVDQRKKHIADQLNDLRYRLHKKIGLTPEQQLYLSSLIQKGGQKAVKDADLRVRAQRGMKESFRSGLEASSRYHGLMRKVFNENNLPEALAHIPHVESAFTNTARSPAGAVGVWQFMPVTGKRYLNIDKAIDERFDPILATRGAAKYLNYAYNKLGDWGLAVTSYNYGLSGMMRARREHGRDIARIVNDYDGASFGFASRNYYVEFLAVCDILSDLPRYFPEGIAYETPPVVKSVELKYAMTSGEIAKRFHVNYAELAQLNPAWTKEAADGLVSLPPNTSVWLPANASTSPNFQIAYQDPSSEMPDNHNLKLFHSSLLPTWDILKEFPNGLSGQLLTAAVAPPTIVPTLPPTKLVKLDKPLKPKLNKAKANDIHIVQMGDSPSTIASKYSVHLRELLALNEMAAGSLIRPGQPIRIPLKING